MRLNLFWEGPVTGPAMVAILRRSLADPTQLRSLRAFGTAAVLGPLSSHVPAASPEEARLRVSMAASTLFGVLIARLDRY